MDKLGKYQWSPEQITGRADRGELYKNLGNSAKKYKKRYGKKDNRGGIPARVSIDQRLGIVEKKDRIGDFEVDLVIGKGLKGALWTCVDRHSGFLLVENVGGKGSDRVAKMTVNALAPYKKWGRIITNDNGKEFAGHLKIADKPDCNALFRTSLLMSIPKYSLYSFIHIKYIKNGIFKTKI